MAREFKRFVQRSGTPELWDERNPVMEEAELGVAMTEAGVVVGVKWGVEGLHWNDLDWWQPGGAGEVQTVNGNAPDVDGDVHVTAADTGADPSGTGAAAASAAQAAAVAAASAALGVHAALVGTNAHIPRRAGPPN